MASMYELEKQVESIRIQVKAMALILGLDVDNLPEDDTTSPDNA